MKNKNIIIAAGVCVLSVVLLIVSVAVFIDRPVAEDKTEAVFIPPEFDKNALKGVPESPGESYTKLYKEGMPYIAYVCGKIKLKDGKIDLYFTNDESNETWLKLRIFDENNQIIGETGLIKPGEYLKSVNIKGDIKNGTNIKVKIMGYEPETYYSAGSIVFNPLLTVE